MVLGLIIRDWKAWNTKPRKGAFKPVPRNDCLCIILPTFHAIRPDSQRLRYFTPNNTFSDSHPLSQAQPTLPSIAHRVTGLFVDCKDASDWWEQARAKNYQIVLRFQHTCSWRSAVKRTERQSSLRFPLPSSHAATAVFRSCIFPGITPVLLSALCAEIAQCATFLSSALGQGEAGYDALSEGLRLARCMERSSQRLFLAHICARP